MDAGPAPARPALGLNLPEQALLFTMVVVAASLILQRFGFAVGGKAASVVGPLGLGAAALGLIRGTLSFNRLRLSLFLVLCGLSVLGIAAHQAQPGRFQTGLSLQSVLQFLTLTSFATLTFTAPVAERAFARRVSAVLAVVAVAGLLQFAAQFAGLRLFTFRGIVPDSLLFEDGYNQIIPAGFGNVYKSNGFFLLEPSIFSQFMALALMMELLVLRRLRMLVLFAAGMLLSIAGTGWIVLGAFVGTVAFSMRRGVLILLLTLGLLAVLAAGVTLLAPEVADSLSARLDEVTRPATSGHLRFITPFWLLDDVLRDEPGAALLGIGGGVSEHLTMPYEYTVNTPVKIAVDYGFPALIVYVALLAVGRKSPMQRAMLVPCMVMLLFAGGYQQLAPVLFPVLLIMTVAKLGGDEVL